MKKSSIGKGKTKKGGPKTFPKPSKAGPGKQGNTLRTGHPTVRRLIVDSLRRRATEMRVDGFRFDLASIFARDSEGALKHGDPPVIAEIEGDLALTDLHLIAEPWDAADAFQLGRDFPGALWMQRNACYRDTLQRFVRGDGGLAGEFMTRLYGSSDLFPDDATIACRPYQSVNYLASHDGSTMYPQRHRRRRIANWIAAIEHSRLFESLGSKLTVEIVDDATDER